MLETYLNYTKASKIVNLIMENHNWQTMLEDMKIIFDEKDENGNYYPLIVVPGISQSTMYVVDENYDYESAEDPTYPPIKHDAWGNELTGELLIFDIAATVSIAVVLVILTSSNRLRSLYSPVSSIKPMV